MLCHLSALLPVHWGVGVSKGTTVTLAAPCNSLCAGKQLIWYKDIFPGNDVEYQFCVIVLRCCGKSQDRLGAAACPVLSCEQSS